jgi:hypothetical protein
MPTPRPTVTPPLVRELWEIIGNEYMDETARRRLFAYADRLDAFLAPLLERDAQAAAAEIRGEILAAVTGELQTKPHDEAQALRVARAARSLFPNLFPRGD